MAFASDLGPVPTVSSSRPASLPIAITFEDLFFLLNKACEPIAIHSSPIFAFAAAK
uniref:Uncharacterized protein n=1 Tax=Lepeophtheirus salmonis TaxID=72036 RepID=A0A0K2VLW9_LEPSM